MKYIRSLKTFLIAILVILPLSSCSSINKQMASWVGHHQSQLIQSWGPPQNAVPDGNGGQILIYSQNVNLGQTPGQMNTYHSGNIMGGMYSGNSTTSYTLPQQNTYSRTRMFYVNSEGVIYNWRWQGL